MNREVSWDQAADEISRVLNTPAPSFYDAPVPVDFVSPINRFNWSVTINYKTHPPYSDVLFDYDSDTVLRVASQMVEHPNDVAAILIVRQ